MFTIHHEGEVIVLTATMEFTSFGRLAARRQVDELLAGGDAKVVIDLSRIESIDSSGLGSLVSAFRRTREAGGDLCLCGLSRQVRGAFDLTHLDDVISIYDDTEEALAHFAPRSG